MNPGDILLKLAFGATLASTALWIPELRGRRSPRLAAWLFALQAAALIGAIGLLWSYFVGHRFEYAYVAQYSSRALSPQLSLAASWAGQEGSILLWATLVALFGLALLREPSPLARPAMFFLSASQAWLLLLLMVRGPFALSPVVPHDGLGLNPLLEDPWMVVHPPVLFAGYAAMVIPFALGAAALLRGDYRGWNRAVWPWALLAVVVLGAGIALGGIWAYKVLGWGGYWGWDPVENASLVPWLVAVALLHGLLIQRTTQALVRTNLVLAFLGWLTVLGGTYLTRSGVLQDFSVHSFADSGLNTPLIAFMGVTIAAAIALLVPRWRGIPGARAAWGGLSRESALWVGLLTVIVFAVMVAFGTTSPLLTALAGKPASVRASFYQSMSIPLGLAVVLLMAVAPALRWSRQAGLTWLAALAPGLVGGFLALAGALFARMTDPGQVALIAVAGIALGINAWMTVRLFLRGWAYGAGYLGHAGIALMVLGIVLSTGLGRSDRVQLAEGQPKQALGYTLTYRGVDTDARGRQVLRIHVQSDDWTLEARPQLFRMPRGEGTMRKPAIDGWRELYLSPLEVGQESGGDGEVTWLAKGQPVEAGGARWTFAGFRTASHESYEVAADIDVARDGRTVRVSPKMVADASGSHAFSAEVPGMGAVRLERIDADNGRIGVRLPGTAVTPVAVIEVSTKPMVNLVWIGAVLALIGSAIAGLRRALEVSSAAPRGRTVPASAVAEAVRQEPVRVRLLGKMNLPGA